MDDLMCKRCFDELPLPAFVVGTQEGRVLFVNKLAKAMGLKSGQSVYSFIEDKKLIGALIKGEQQSFTAALAIESEKYTAELNCAQTVFEEEPALIITLTEAHPVSYQSEGRLMMDVCDIFVDGAKQPITAFLKLTAAFSGAFYAAIYEKVKGRYLIKGEWRARRSVCVPILGADFEAQPEKELARLRRLKRAGDVTTVRYEKYGVQGAVLYFFDNSLKKTAREHLEKAVKLYAYLSQKKQPSPQMAVLQKGLDALAQGFAIWDVESTKLKYVNKVYEEMFGNGSARMISEKLRTDLRPGARKYSEYTDMAGNSFSISHSAVKHGRQTIAATLVTDISKYKQAELRLEQMAKTDALTGLFNRRAGIEALEALYSKCKSKKTPLTVCFADIDGLKRINDTYGHGAGDNMIRMAAGILKNNVEDSGFVCRLGGDEFVLILPGFKESEARMLASHITKAVSNRVINGIQGIDISFGFTQARYNPEESAATLVSVADSDMYSEKRKKIRR